MIQWLGLTLPLQGPQVRSLVGELRFHMLPGTVKKENTHTPKTPRDKGQRTVLRAWRPWLHALPQLLSRWLRAMWLSLPIWTAMAHQLRICDQGVSLLKPSSQERFPCFFLDKAAWLRVQAWHGNKPEFKSWFCPLTCYASLGRFFICEMDLIILVSKYFLGGPVAKTPSYQHEGLQFHSWSRN